ncbi:uncharacterized protein [Anabrus simplex]|uniref:uncharacterized protein isoform X2 n=1 Tax=Anabrus simplex TaxID=316456 RepID=UPI0035A31F60
MRWPVLCVALEVGDSPSLHPVVKRLQVLARRLAGRGLIPVRLTYQVSPELKLVALSELRSRLAHSAHTGGVFPDPTMIPEPELCPGDDLEKRNRRNQGPPAPPLPPLSAEGLILPRKPPNPCLESVGHKNLHRELLFNQKVGKNVLNQKSELQKAFGKHREQQVRKELEQQRANAKSDLARMVEERARRMDLLDKGEEEPEKCSENEPEFLKVHAKMRARMDSK